MYSDDDMEKINIPSVLKTGMKEVKKKYFLGCRETGRKSPVFWLSESLWALLKEISELRKIIGKVLN